MTPSASIHDLLNLQGKMILSVDKLLDLQGFASNLRSPVWIGGAFVVLTILWYSVRVIAAARRPPYPPGPKGLPIIGNLLQLNDEPWFIFTEWKKKYGPMVYLNIGGQPVIVLNTHKVCGDLLDRRANIYSDRPRMIVAAETLTRGGLLGLSRYGDLWRRMRRAAHGSLNQSAATQYFRFQQAESVLLASGLLTEPDQWHDHLRRTAASTFTSMVYDTPPLHSATDPAIKDVGDLASRVTQSSAPGAHLVEFFTFLEYFPKVVSKWKREADDWYKRYTVGFIEKYSKIQDSVAKGEDQSQSFAATLAGSHDRHNLNQTEAAWLAATMYVAGSDTTSSSLSWFLYAMVVFPEAQEKAVAEIDAIVGRSRLPSFNDWDHLPYCRALLREVLRWYCVDPLGIPHSSVEDDVYEGYFIPKGTILLTNIWSMNRDVDMYGPDATLFKPERHLDENGQLKSVSSATKDDGHVNFGFGRRICVGRHIANNTIFINIITVLWALKIEPPKDFNGKDIIPNTDTVVNDGLVIRPSPFKFIATPRFPEVESMLNSVREDNRAYSSRH